MKLTIFTARLILLFCFFSVGCFGFSSSSGSSLLRRHRSAVQQQQHLVHSKLLPQNLRSILMQETVSRSNENDDSRAASLGRRVPSFVYKVNSSTKWLVTIANTLAIWTRIHRYEGPFVVVGAILSVYFTDALKKILNHDRPAGAPFADPGMPSSHSLVSFFMVAAWSNLVLPTSFIGITLLLASASSIAMLRVVCGYHSWAQVGVGAVLGSGMGLSWAKLGSFVATHGHPTAVFRLSWSLYILGSGLFIVKNMREWLHRDKHL